MHPRHPRPLPASLLGLAGALVALLPGTAPADPLRRTFERLPGDGTSRSDVRILPDNAESWAARWALMGAARETIDFHTFIIDPDVFGVALLGRLLEKAEAGVRVRFMTESLGSLKFKTPSGRALLRALAAHERATVKLYKPLYKGFLKAIGEADVHQLTACNHDKILVVDRTLALTGGRNLAARYLVDPPDRADTYRDTDVLVRGGRAVLDLEAAFLREFEAPLNSEVRERRILPELRSRERLLPLVARGMDLWLAAEPFAPDVAARLRDREAGGRDRAAVARMLLAAAVAGSEASGRDRDEALGWFEELAGYPGTRGALRAFRLEERMVRGVEARVMDQTSDVGDGHDDLRPNLLRMMLAAREEARIQTPAVTLTAGSVRVLERAASHGVRIELLTNGFESAEAAFYQGLFLRLWPEYLARIPTLDLTVFSHAPILHAKTAIFDRVLTLIGSYNMDTISEVYNGEVAVAIWSPEVARIAAAIDARDRDPGRDPSRPRIRRYTIARDPATRGPRRGADGRVEVEHGPEHHLGERYRRIIEIGDRLATPLTPEVERFKDRPRAP